MEKEKPSIFQRILGYFHNIQEQIEKSEQEKDKKSGLTRAQRTENKYQRDLQFEEQSNQTEVVSDDD